MSPKKKYSKEIKNAAGEKVRVLRRKAILQMMQEVHTELQHVVDLHAQGAQFTHESLPQFNYGWWDAEMREILHKIEKAGDALHN